MIQAKERVENSFREGLFSISSPDYISKKQGIKRHQVIGESCENYLKDNYSDA